MVKLFSESTHHPLVSKDFTYTKTWIKQLWNNGEGLAMCGWDKQQFIEELKLKSVWPLKFSHSMGLQKLNEIIFLPSFLETK